MREKFIRFMYGRNGMDDMSNFEIKIAWIPLLLSILLRRIPYANDVFTIIFWALLIHSYFRVFSKNITKRYDENQRFLNWRYNMAVKMNRQKRRLEQKKEFCFFKCPMCKQEVRVPKGHGKIEITCPKCREKFVRRS